MNLTVIMGVFGVLLMAYSVTMIPPVIVAHLYNDGGVIPFLCAFAITFCSGLVIWSCVSGRPKRELRAKDGFFIVVMFWTILAFYGALPLFLFQNPDISFTHSIFEAVSGLTTTGATVLTGLDEMPKSLLYYRQQMQWLGGMGIIVLAVAVLPMLGVGGMQLYRAETPGPMKDSKLTPRITETAKALWYIYLALTVVCTWCYWLAGMTVFDAISHGFSTIATGGSSTYDDSIGAFDSVWIESICVFFMLISSLNYALHFACWQNKGLMHYWRDAEVRVFFYGLLLIIVTCVLVLWLQGVYENFGEAMRYGVFQAVAVTTSTGFGIDNFSLWPSVLATLLLMGSFMGGCAGSTAGGLKVIRVWLMIKQGIREIKKLIHPASVTVIKVGSKPVPDKVVEAVSGYIGAYVLVFVFLLLMVMATGVDFETGVSAVAASLNNLGPGLGDVAGNYSGLSASAKWVLCLAMLFGRLEIFPILVFFTPWFWRH